MSFTERRRAHGQRQVDIATRVKAIAACYVHPKYLNDSVLDVVGPDSEYLVFSDHLFEFHWKLQMAHDAGAAPAELLELIHSEWERHVSNAVLEGTISPEFSPLLLATAFKDELVELLGEESGD